MRKGNRSAVAWVIVLAMLACLQEWVSGRRPMPAELRTSHEFLVTTEADDGAGSLREAIFAAARAAGRSRIRLSTPRIRLRTALPPIANRDGVLIEGLAGVTEIDASGLESGPVIDIDSPGARLSEIRIVNARDQAVVVRKNGVTIARSAFVNCDQGIHLLEGVEDIVVEGSTFTRNRSGIWVAAATGRLEIRDNQFSEHADAGIWAVRRRQAGEPLLGQLHVARNRFDRDRISMVVANMPLLVEDNEFAGAREAALLLIGEGAVVRRNRIRNGTGVGLIADDTRGAVIEGNEINHNYAIGVLVRSSGDALIRKNQVYANGYGLAFVFGRSNTPNTGAENTLIQQVQDGVIVIGDSPVLRENHVLNGNLAGLRILDYYSSEGTRTASDPLLQRNKVEGNRLNPTVHGEYRAPAKRRGER